ncbi:MAG: serine hydrolase [Candidatus Peribacteraceae bacterium]|nr:serine hydrolase [Candidatus Peribacteraceae bacterium]
MLTSSVLSALLLGLFPVMVSSPAPLQFPLTDMRIAPPAEEITLPRRLSASGAFVLDLRTGQALYALQSGIERPMASLTKLMTALLIVENHDLQEWVTIPQGTELVKGSIAYLPVGEQFTVGDLLTALLVASANDAAAVLAQHHSGTMEKFVEEMNARAIALGLIGTHYANPSGMDHPRQWSTPRDMAVLTSFVLQQPSIRQRMGIRGTVIRSRGGQEIRLLHTHALVRSEPEIIPAGKTGTTGAAGQCLVSLVEKDGHDYLVVLLHSAERYRDMNTILASLLGIEGVTAPVEETECLQGGGCPAHP